MVDLHSLASGDKTMEIKMLIEDLVANFIEIDKIDKEFPFIYYGGVLTTYPVMWLIIPSAIFIVMKRIKLNKDIMFLLLGFIFTSIMITVLDIYWSGGLMERYRLDIYFLIGNILFFLIAAINEYISDKGIVFTRIMAIFVIASFFFVFLLFMRPRDYNFAELCLEEAEKIEKIVMFDMD